MSSQPKLERVEFRPLTKERWNDLEKLFGPRGAYGGCWCMYWRLPRSQWSQQCGEGNKYALKAVVESGEVPGILAYASGQPVGWCSVAPREAFGSLERSRKLKRVDSEPVWSIVCFYVDKPFRRKGLGKALLQGAVEHVRSCGRRIVEGYPVRPDLRTADVNAYMGVASTFLECGFVEVTRPSQGRSVMRYYLD